LEELKSRLNHTERALQLILAKLDTLQPQEQQQQEQQVNEVRRRKHAKEVQKEKP